MTITVASLGTDMLDWVHPAGIRIERDGEILWVSYDHGSLVYAPRGCVLEPRIFVHSTRGYSTVLLEHNTEEVVDEGLSLRVTMLEHTDSYAKIRLSNNAVSAE